MEKHSLPQNEIIEGIQRLSKENLEPIGKDTSTGRPRQCQGDPICKNHSLEGKAFCAKHMESCPRKSPLNGWEPEYDPNLWNAKKSIRHTHNCYSYAMNVHDSKQSEKCKKRMKIGKDCFSGFHQPGTPSKYSKFSNSSQKTCDNMYARLKGDNPDIQKTTFEAKCPPKMSKIALVVDKNEDYHFLRQDSNGYWSHKPGGRPITNRDASNRPIWDPQLCDLNYTTEDHDSHLNYDVFCNYLCVPRDKPLNMKVGGSRRGRRRGNRASTKRSRGSFSRRAKTFRRRSLKPYS